MKDYFAILEIDTNSNELEIRNAYRRLAKKYHPDLNKAADAQDKFIEISEAYEFLIKHREQYFQSSANTSDSNQKSTDFWVEHEFEKFNQLIRERAKRQAKIKYEEFKKQHEAFQKSGLNDLALLFKMFVRIALIPLVFFLLLLPIHIAFNNEWNMIFLLFLTWPFAGILVKFIYDERKHYFKPGEFYYSFKLIKQIFSEINTTEENCYYCASEKANSKPYKLDLLQLKDLKVKSSGFRQHNANYINDDISVLVPRSKKALIVHSVNTGIKVVSIIYCLFFFGISSLVWRIIIGMFLGAIISSLVLLITSTKSNVSYLIGYGAVFRVFVWIFIIISISNFSFAPFNIETSGAIYFVITSIMLFDCLLMQILDIIFRKYSSKPAISQYPEVNQKFNDGYRVYNDITIISVVYPIYKWIFG